MFRRKTRTILTLASIAAALLLFGMLDAERTAFESGSKSVVGVDRPITSSRYSIIQSLPQALPSRISGIAGVRDVAYTNGFGGIYQDPKTSSSAMP